MRAVLKRPDFRLLFGGLFFSMSAESILLLALAIWAKDLTGSDGMAGATILAVIAPMTLAPVIGFVVDRFRRRPFLVSALLISALGLSPLLLVVDRDDLWILFAVAVGYGLSFISVSAALNGLIKEVIPEQLLAEANGALQTVRQGLRLIAPLIGAGLYTVTKSWGLAVAGMTGFLLAATVIYFLKASEPKPTRTESRWLAEVTAGVRHLLHTPSLKRALIGTVCAITVFGFSESVFFAFVDQGLHKPPTFLAVIVSVQGIGGLLGGLTASKVVNRFGEITAMALGMLLFLPVFVTSIFPSVYLIFPVTVMGGWGLPWVIVGLMTLMQRVTPGAIMGRVSSAMDALISGPQALSIALGAILVEQLPFRLLLGFCSVICAISALYLWASRALSRPPLTPTPVAAAP